MASNCVITSATSSQEKLSRCASPEQGAINTQVTARDKWVLALLQIGQLDSRQIFRASQAGSFPFSSPHKTAARMRKLNALGLLRTYEWKITLTGTKVYYATTPKGRSLVLGKQTARRSLFYPISLVEQEHKHRIGDVTAATVAAAARLDCEIVEHSGDRQFQAVVPGETDIKPNEPDRRCLIIAPDKQIELWDEIDMHTESISGTAYDSLEKKILFHTRRRRALPQEDYLVRLFFRHAGSRMRKFLELAAKHAQNNEFIFIATTFDAYLNSSAPLTDSIFFDHAMRPRRCYKPYRPKRQTHNEALEHVPKTLVGAAAV